MGKWMEIRSEEREALVTAAQELGVHPLALEDSINRDQRAKLEEYDKHQFLVWYMYSKGTIYEIQFIIFPDLILMVPHEMPPQGETWREFFRLSDSDKDARHMLYQVLDRATDITWNETQKLFQQLDDFEQSMFASDCDPMSLLSLKKQLNFIDFSIGHLPSLVLQIQNYYHPKDDLRWRFRDLHDHCERISREISLHRTQIGTTIELYWGHQANRTNSHIKKMSLLASVAMPLTFWASFWGMNFEAIPFANPAFFTVALLVMFSSVLFVLWVFIKKGYWSD